MVRWRRCEKEFGGVEPLPKRAGDGFVEEELFVLTMLKKKRERGSRNTYIEDLHFIDSMNMRLGQRVSISCNCLLTLASAS